jgi:hypothetical protein
MQPVPEAGPRKIQNVNKKEENNCHSDWYAVKNVLKNYNAGLGASEETWAQEKRKEERVQNLYSEIHKRNTEKLQEIEEWKLHKIRRLEG